MEDFIVIEIISFYIVLQTLNLFKACLLYTSDAADE